MKKSHLDYDLYLDRLGSHYFSISMWWKCPTNCLALQFLAGLFSIKAFIHIGISRLSNLNDALVTSKTQYFKRNYCLLLALHCVFSFSVLDIFYFRRCLFFLLLVLASATASSISFLMGYRTTSHPNNPIPTHSQYKTFLKNCSDVNEIFLDI